MKGLGTQKQLWVLGWHKSYAGHIILGLMPTFYENHLSLLFSFLFLHLFYVFFYVLAFYVFFSCQLASARVSLHQLASARISRSAHHWLLRFLFRHSYFVKLFDAGLQCEFIWTFLYYNIKTCWIKNPVVMRNTVLKKGFLHHLVSKCEVVGLNPQMSLVVR